MTRKDYVRVAKALATTHQTIINDYPGRMGVLNDRLITLRQVADALAEVFYLDNPRFEYQTFIRACGLESI